MLTPTVSPISRTAYLRNNWWVYLLTGLVNVIFGIAALVYPGGTAVTLALFYGAFAIISGIVTIIGAFQARNATTQWGWLFVTGALAVIAGFIAIVWPGITLLTFVYIVAGWAFLTGALEIFSFLRMSDHAHHLWMVLAGVLSILFAVLAVAYPSLTLQLFITFIAVFAIISGVMRIIFAFQVRSAT